MNKFLPFFFFLMCQTVVFGQQEIRWTEILRKTGYIQPMDPIINDQFYVLVKKGNVFRHYEILRFDDLKEVERTKIKFVVDQNVGGFEEVFVIDDQPAVLFSNRMGSINTFYAQKYGYELKPLGTAEAILEVQVETKQSVKLVRSKNTSYLAAVWVNPGKRRASDEYGFILYDAKFNLLDSGSFALQSNSELTTGALLHLSDQGELFMAHSEYEINENRGFLGEKYLYKSLHVARLDSKRIVEGTLAERVIALPAERIESVKMESREDELNIVALIGDRQLDGVSGVFTTKFRSDNLEQLVQTKTYFSEELIKEEPQRTFIDEVQLSRPELLLKNYKLQKFFPLDSSSLIGVMEQYYVIESAMPDFRSSSAPRYTYFFNDVLVFKKSLGNAEFDWVKRIPKEQVSSSDYGYYSSIALAEDSTDIHVLFNDNRDNYDELRNFRTQFQRRVKQSSLTKRKNVVAQVKVSKTDGEVDRSYFTSRAELGIILSPGASKLDGVNNQLILIGNVKYKVRLGLMRF